MIHWEHIDMLQRDLVHSVIKSIGKGANDAGLQFNEEPARLDISLQTFLFGALLNFMIDSEFNISDVRKNA